MTTKAITFYFLSLLLCVTTVLPAQDESVASFIQQRIEHIMQGEDHTIYGIHLYNPQGMASYYSEYAFEPSWTDSKNRSDLLKVLEASHDHGLLPEDYHLETLQQIIEEMEAGNDSPALEADLDILMTDATSLYANHMMYGKVDQSSIRGRWDLPPNPPLENPRELLHQALQDRNLIAAMEGLAPSHFMYIHLKNGLANYREIAENGGWPKIPEGEVLKPGMTDKRIPVLREYLTITGDYPSNAPAGNDNVYDETMEAAVKQFQFRHNLIQDGVIGKGTLEQMNVSVLTRIDMIRLNMERARWLMHKLESDFLVVNIAGFNARRITNDQTVYYSPVIVGKKYHQSPIFKGTVKYIVINPTWTVPYSISTKEMLPKLKKDPGYLASKHLIIMDRNGKKLDPYSIDFSQYSRGNFPFVIRQEPGPWNALGEVKFMFPNKYSVYMHDTPARSLFGREERAFSHGCIRLQKKWELLMSLVDDPEWDMDKINEVLASKETTTIKLEKPIDVLILYWTAGADVEDRLYFNRDVYSRDHAVLEALDEPLNY